MFSLAFTISTLGTLDLMDSGLNSLAPSFIFVLLLSG